MPAPDKDGAIRRRVMVGTASNYAGQIIAFASLFFLTPFILRHLGAATYGLWVLVSSIVAYGSVLDLGVWGAIIKYVAEYRARGEADTARALEERGARRIAARDRRDGVPLDCDPHIACPALRQQRLGSKNPCRHCRLLPLDHGAFFQFDYVYTYSQDSERAS